jgi:hypothetical protein
VEVVADVIQGHEDDHRTPQEVDGVDARPPRDRVAASRCRLRVRRFEVQADAGMSQVEHASWWGPVQQ